MPHHQLPNRSPANPDLSAPSSVQPQDRIYSGRRVLLLEDDTFVRDMCSRALVKVGFAVTAMSDTEEAWGRVAREGFDLVVTDHHMPRVTGLELIERLRISRIDTPCILISGNMPLQASSAVARLGRAKAMNKPFSIPDMLAVIAELLHPTGS